MVSGSFRFEVWRDDKCLMSTEHKELVYPYATLDSMKKRGLTFKVNKKKWNPKKRKDGAVDLP